MVPVNKERCILEAGDKLFNMVRDLFIDEAMLVECVVVQRVTLWNDLNRGQLETVVQEDEQKPECGVREYNPLKMFLTWMSCMNVGGVFSWAVPVRVHHLYHPFPSAHTQTVCSHP